MFLIPPHLIPGFKAISLLDARSREALLKVFTGASYSDEMDDLQKGILSAVSDFDEDTARQVATTLMSSLSLGEFHSDLNELALELSTSWADQVESEKQSRFDLQSFLLRLLQDSSNLRFKSKAKRLAREKPNLMIDARLIIDALPVFGFTEDLDDLSHFVLSSTLRIDYVDNSSNDDRSSIKSLFFGVDDSDLEKLEMIVQRSKQKKRILIDKLAVTNTKIIEE